MRRLILAVLIFLAIGPAPGRVVRFPATDLTQRVDARPLAYPADRTGVLRFERGWLLESPHSFFGGFSALAATAPEQFLLVGDNGYWTQLRLGGDSAVTGLRIAPLAMPAGLRRRKTVSDVEALYHDPVDGRLWVALEAIDQVWRFDSAFGHIESRAQLPKPRWPANRGAEAMTRLADGRMVIFSEDANDDSRGREALIFAGDPAVVGTRTARFFYDAEGKGLVSDAATLPDGRLLLVHRRLGFDPLFTTILALVDPADIRPGATVRSQPIGRVPKPLAENYEGAAITIEGGRTILWLVSDNNQNRWQRTLLLKFELSGLPDSKKAARVKPAA